MRYSPFCSVAAVSKTGEVHAADEQGELERAHDLPRPGEITFRRFAAGEPPAVVSALAGASARFDGHAPRNYVNEGGKPARMLALNESGLWNAYAIEAQLAHVDANSVRRAYARAEYWDERVKMMIWWADRCDDMRRGGKVLLVKKSG